MVEARQKVVEQEKVAQMRMGARRGAVDGGGTTAPASGPPATASTPAINALRPSVALHEMAAAQLEQAALRLWKVTESQHRSAKFGLTTTSAQLLKAQLLYCSTSGHTRRIRWSRRSE
ncbi:hypothetical protein FOA52_003453 [Chlamydomonas sp. UWO 241]|nr:hypothetical protein FOA52_003453 [Chlamydomonas sp. UWO 241]